MAERRDFEEVLMLEVARCVSGAPSGPYQSGQSSQSGTSRAAEIAAFARACGFISAQDIVQRAKPFSRARWASDDPRLRNSAMMSARCHLRFDRDKGCGSGHREKFPDANQPCLVIGNNFPIKSILFGSDREIFSHLSTGAVE